MNLLTAAKADERKAPGEYRKLAKKLKSKRERKIIQSIIRDEKLHLKNLRKIKSYRR